MSTALHRLKKSENGFTMIEAVIAMVVFVSSIVGISLMLLSGSGAVSNSAMQNTATQLAQKKIEDIKTLPFYTPWTGANQDIDDFYWAFNNDNPPTPLLNADQLNTTQDGTHAALNPYAYEDYGKISGYGNYKRTTAIEYVSNQIVSNQMAPVTMNSNWVPKSSGNSVDSPSFDTPEDNSTPPAKVRLLLVQVKVSYHPSNTAGSPGLEQFYTEQAVVNDLMTTSGSTVNPAPTVTSIDPNNANTGNTSVSITNLAGTNFYGTPTVQLQMTGQNSITATNVTVVSSTQITCSFDLTGAAVGIWDVYVQNPDTQSATLIGGFTVNKAGLSVTSITPNSAYTGNTSVSITNLAGTNFYGTPTVQLKMTGQTSITATTGSVNVPSSTKITCTFDLGGAATGIWDVYVQNPDGQAPRGPISSR